MSTIAVIGLGYVGLPLAVHAAENGYCVTGVDINNDLVSAVNKRISPFVNDARFDRALTRVPTDRFIATLDYNIVSTAEIIIICVPTPTLNNTPDISLVIEAINHIATRMHKDQLIIVESTVGPGVIRDEILPILENISGLRVGKDFLLAHCPERIDPGNKHYFVGNLNRVVGGVTQRCTEKAKRFYESFIEAEILAMSSLEEAEFVKSWENTHRNVMIALANNAAQICDAMCMNIDNVLAGLQTKVDQFGLSLAKPGIGPGGHCIPEDIHYVIKQAREDDVDTCLLESAVLLNDSMPKYAVSKLQKEIANMGDELANMHVALLGVGYKGDVDDFRRSPAVEIGYLIARYAKSLLVHDPYVDLVKSEPIKGSLSMYSLESVLERSEIVVVGTGHSIYKRELNLELLTKFKIKYVLDCRNMLNPKIFKKSDIRYVGIGR